MDKETFAMRLIDNPTVVSQAYWRSSEQFNEDINRELNKATTEAFSLRRFEAILVTSCFGAIASLYEFDLLSSSYVMRVAQTLAAHEKEKLALLKSKDWEALFALCKNDLDATKNYVYIAELFQTCATYDDNDVQYIDAMRCRKYLKEKVSLLRRLALRVDINKMTRNNTVATKCITSATNQMLSNLAEEYFVSEASPVRYAKSETEKELADIGIGRDTLSELVACLELTNEAVRVYKYIDTEYLLYRLSRTLRLSDYNAPVIIMFNEYAQLAKLCIRTKIFDDIIGNKISKMEVINVIKPFLVKYVQAVKSNDVSGMEALAEEVLLLCTGTPYAEWKIKARDYKEPEQ